MPCPSLFHPAVVHEKKILWQCSNCVKHIKEATANSSKLASTRPASMQEYPFLHTPDLCFDFSHIE
eukprot:CAMPEP_0203673860 /NCGR_PEP_ID=MMETSP0090-20130426/14135_1 /ASSEMBLY_ACC=CAM_ASM_001088 /TAXON_ID=426623 /ORGANISM="Chaetoceros affinis, Strain CCMP159" /LENGTH=65 /DNA_ID=CAMNT_0050539595 /DNA_START=59 /DNA_END=256 /DNA_ORIENTATION=+